MGYRYRLEPLAGLISFLISLFFVVCLLFAVLGGLFYIFSWGGKERARLAKNGLKYSLVGFAISLVSWLAVDVVYQISYPFDISPVYINKKQIPKIVFYTTEFSSFPSNGPSVPSRISVFCVEEIPLLVQSQLYDER